LNHNDAVILKRKMDFISSSAVENCSHKALNVARHLLSELLCFRIDFKKMNADFIYELRTKSKKAPTTRIMARVLNERNGSADLPASP